MDLEGTSVLAEPLSPLNLDAHWGLDNDLPQFAPAPFGALIPVLEPNDSRLSADVINLSSIRLSDQQIAAIQTSVKFRKTPSSVPYSELIASVECTARHLDQTDLYRAASFRADCALQIARATNPRPNLKPGIRNALTLLANNEQLVVTVADKGGKPVVLHILQYGEMCMKHLEDPVYQRINEFGAGRGRIRLDAPGVQLFSKSYAVSDPSDHLLRHQCQRLTLLLNKLKRSRDIGAEERTLLLPGQPYSGVIPKFYGLPKVHKVGPVQLRPIISNYGLYSDKVMLTQKNILNCLLWGTTTVSKSYEFVQLMQEYQFGDKDHLVSFDVKSLFTKVLVQEALRVVEQHLTEIRLLPEDPIRQITTMSNSAILQLLNLLLGKCYFTWEKGLYRQV